jgi:hypothetical protein
MKTCPNGAIVTRDELKVIAGALEVAVETIGGYMDSERRPNRNDHDAEYLANMQALKESRADYRRCLKSVDRLMKPARKKAA